MECCGCFVEHHIFFVCFKKASRMFARLLHKFTCCNVHCNATLLKRTRTHGSATLWHKVGIAPHHVNLVHWNSCCIGGDHCPRRDMALTMWRGSGVHNCATVLRDFDLCGLSRAVASGDFYIHADADSQLLHASTCTSCCLFCAKFGVVGCCKNSV